jgi:hypothetical protein
MMRGFRRAQLKGSDELFRPTQTDPAPAEPAAIKEPAPVATAVPRAPSARSRSVRLTEDEIAVLIDALQHLKFPKPAGRPPMHEYERFEELRQKLLASL